MPDDQKPNVLKAEILGIVFLAMSILLGFSLVAYHIGTSQTWFGLIGNNISWALFVTIGYVAYSFPIIFLIIAIEFLFKERRGIGFRISLPISHFFFILSSSAIISIITGDSASGGIVGSLASQYMSAISGKMGSLIILGAVLVISIRIGTGLSFVQLIEKTFAASVFIARGVYALASLVNDRLKQRAEKKAQEPAVLSEKRSRTQPAIVTQAIQKPKRQKAGDKVQEEFQFAIPKGTFQLPMASFLDPPHEKDSTLDKDALLTNSKILEKKLKDFDVDGAVTEVRPGPLVTTYEFEPAPGVKVNKIVNLSDDLALALRAQSIRILAPVPGKAVVGIEVPNQKREWILIRELIDSPRFQNSQSPLALAFGKDISGAPFVTDLQKMPHLLVAGSTGAGKSVFINALIISILYKATPDDVRFLMVDPKMLELSLYEGIPHLLTPVVTDVKRANTMLKTIVSEMEKRYGLMAEVGAKNIEKYNALFAKKPKEGGHGKLPYIVIVIDELADLMMAVGKDVEESLVRLSQMARASGIHIIAATQRPSVDVITGLIKANFPARVSFQVPSRTDSRTILDAMGAESLLGEGDMLFLPPGSSKLLRIHGVYVSEKEIKRVSEFLKKQAKPPFEKEIIDELAVERVEETADLGEDFLEKYKEAVDLAMRVEMISTSYIQRRFRIGYNTAARMIEMMERDGIVGPQQGSRPREVLKRTLKEE